MNPESKFTRWIAKELLHDAHIQRIETTTGSGVPDINVCWHGVEMWLEAKVATPGGNTLLRPFQWAWAKRRHSVGGKVVLISEYGDHVAIWEHRQIGVTVHGPHLRFHTTPSIKAPRTWAGICSLRSFLMKI